jgi:hypothetical protein
MVEHASCRRPAAVSVVGAAEIFELERGRFFGGEVWFRIDQIQILCLSVDKNPWFQSVVCPSTNFIVK